MSIWTCKILRLGATASMAAVLAGCSPTTGGGTVGLLSPSTEISAPVRSAALFDGAVVVAGPPGYCIDPNSVRQRAGSSFALLASCTSLTGSADLNVDPAVLTVSVLAFEAEAQQPPATDIAKSMSPAKVLEEIDGDGVSLVHFATGGSGGVPGGDPRYWRAGMVINGHVVALAAYGPAGSKVATTRGRVLLMDMAEALRDESPLPGIATGDDVELAETNGSEPVVAKPKPRGLKSIISGLFPNPA